MQQPFAFHSLVARVAVIFWDWSRSSRPPGPVWTGRPALLLVELDLIRVLDQGLLKARYNTFDT